MMKLVLFSARPGRFGILPRLRALCVLCAYTVSGSLIFGGLAAAETPSLPQKPAAAETAAPSVGPSGLPLPRFVTLKSGHVNMRVGPDMGKYPVSWSYRRRGLPVEIIQEYGNWRRIRDVGGTMGWVNAALLSGRRGAIIEPGKTGKNAPLVPLYAEPSEKSRVVIKAEPGVIGAALHCSGTWCELSIESNSGYIRQEKLWGVYRREIIR